MELIIGVCFPTNYRIKTGYQMKKSIVLATIFFLVGCAASSLILVGKSRPPISPEAVKLYIKPPSKYEEIAILDSSSKSSWAVTDQGKMDVAIQRLKEEAAKVGANGILINGTGDGLGGGVVTGNTSGGVSSGVFMSVFHKTARGVAIFVESE
jgi:hypothetical protein